MSDAAVRKAEPLKRLGGGRWQTRDERFTIEPQSGTWVIVDAEQTDDLGLPLVRGPFSSLTGAKDAIDAARDSAPSVSPLAERAGKLRERQATAGSDRGGDPPTGRRTRAAAARDASPATPAASSKRPTRAPRQTAAEPSEPRWLAELEADERRRARRLITALDEAGAKDPEGIARRDIEGKVPAAAAFAVASAVTALGSDADPAAVAAMLADGQDRALGVRWRLVDGDGRPISLDPKAIGKR